MAKTKEQKKQDLENLIDKLKESKAVVFTNFSGLKVKDTEQLRNKCREAGVEYLVAKKTLLKKALQEIGLETGDFNGEIGTAFSKDDEVAAAKILNDFSRDHSQITLLAGILENKIINENDVKGLANLPSKEELLSKVVGSINAPVSGFVNVLAGNIRGLVQVLNGIKESRN